MTSAMIAVGEAAGQRGLVVGAAQYPDDRPGLGGVPRLEVAHGVPHHRHGPRVLDAEAGHGAQDHVGGGPAPTDVRRRQRQIDLRDPAQCAQQGVAGRRGEAGGEADLDPVGAQVAQDLAGARHLAHIARRHDRLVGGGEGGGGPRRLFGSEQTGEHVRLGPTHRLEHEGVRLVVAPAARLDPHHAQRAGERLLDGAVVAHGRAGHIETGRARRARSRGHAHNAGSPQRVRRDGR